MPRNLIVTCGTSQIEQRRLQKAKDAALINKVIKEKRSEEKTWQSLFEYTENVQKPAQGIDDQFIQQLISQQTGKQLTGEGQFCKTLSDGLVRRWGKINDDIGKLDNPFGAEISTLHKMKTTSPSFFDPATDSVVLLYSDTGGGAFCAGVLYHLLTHQQVYAMPQNNITCKRIPELREEPRNVVVAEDETRKALLRARKKQEGIKNIFVMTGGFKSTLPILTVIAVLYGEPIYYLFERSKELRHVDPQATAQSSWWLSLIAQRKTQKDERTGQTSVILTVSTDVGIDLSVPEPQVP